MKKNAVVEKFLALTPQPRRVLELLLAGKTDSEIAAEIGIGSLSTVRKHVQNLCDHFEIKREFEGLQRNRRDDLITLGRNYLLELDRENDFPDKKSDTRDFSHSECVNDWGEAVDVSIFYGREKALNELEEWIVQSKVRLIALLGMGGIGKTALSVKLAQKLQYDFKYIIWRSLRSAPALEDILTDLIEHLAGVGKNLPSGTKDKLSLLLEHIQKQRCLIILDNVESILEGEHRAGYYREGYEQYGDLFKLVGETPHKSCLVLTSREKPKEVAVQEGEIRPVRSFLLDGLKEEAQNIFKENRLNDLEENATKLIHLYGGNPLALNIVSAVIRDFFDGRISDFLNSNALIFGDIKDLIDEQFSRLSNLEKEIMYWLAINREPVSLLSLKDDLALPISQSDLIEAIESLNRRALVEKSKRGFTQQAVVIEYMTNRLVKEVCEEIKEEKIKLFNSYALIKADSRDYVRSVQVVFILKPVADKLLAIFGNIASLENKLKQILYKYKKNILSLRAAYAPGNIINLLRHVGVNFTGYDFSHLDIRQAFLMDINLYNVNFSQSNLSKSIFSETLSDVSSVAFSPNGNFLVTGDASGKVYLWEVESGRFKFVCKDHDSWVRTVAFSPNGKIIASGSEDRSVRLWNADTGNLEKILQGHQDWVWSVSFSPDSQYLASASGDCTIRIWNVDTGECLTVLEGHNQRVRAIAFSPTEKILASGSDDCTIKLWDLNSGECFLTLEGHSEWVKSVAFSPTEKILASGSDDCTIKLWDLNSGECFLTLKHTAWIWAVAFSSDGQFLASGDDKGKVTFWNINNGQYLKNLEGHTSRIRTVAFSPDGQTFASGSGDCTVRLWNSYTAQCFRTLRGQINKVTAIAFNPNGQTLASGSQDGVLRLWSITEGWCEQVGSHTRQISSVMFSPDGKVLASSSGDHTIKLWGIPEKVCIRTLQEHTNLVWAVTFSPDGSLLASTSEDKTIRLWNVHTGKCLEVIQLSTWVWSIDFSVDGKFFVIGTDDHQVTLWSTSTRRPLKTLGKHSLEKHWGQVWSVAFSPDGQLIASGSEDKTVKLWNPDTGECVRTFKEHTQRVESVVFSPDGQLIASGSEDKTVKLWNPDTGECVKTLEGHTDRIRSVAFSSDSQTVASGSEDQTIRVWNVKSSDILTLSAKPYEGMNITGVEGLSNHMKDSLKILGAIEVDN